MTSANASPLPKNSFLSWQFALIQLLLLAAIAILLTRPVGSIQGQIALEQEGFNLHTYDMRGNNVYAIAIGPRDGISDERGVWVDSEGKFKITDLPCGEYSLKLRVPGFSTTYESGIFVEEGKVTQIKDPILLEIAHPSVSTASNMRVFTTGEKPTFWAQASNARTMKVRVYKKDILEILKMENGKNSQELGLNISPDLSVYKPYEAEDLMYKWLLKSKPVKEFKRDLPEKDWVHQEFAFSEPLEPGDYVVVSEAQNLKGENDWSISWFSVTNLGLIIKQAPEKVVARALDLKTMKPVSGVELSILHRESNEMTKSGARTGADGFAVISGNGDLGLTGNVLICGFKGKDRAYGGMNIYRSAPDELKTYFYTERPVYRLGQTVFFKGICRRLDGQGFHNSMAGEEIHVKFEDPDNATLWEGDLKANKFGTFHGTVNIPEEGKTGAYQITMTYADGRADYERIEVMQYRKPEYKVEVTPLEDRVTAGQHAKVRVRATYYFGAPVTNAKVKYSIYSSIDYSNKYKLRPQPDYYGYFDCWDGGDYDSYGGGEFVTEGYVQTDETGEAIVDFPTQEIDRSPGSVFNDAFNDRRYKVDVEVTDISRLSVVGSGSLLSTAGDFVVFVDPESSVIPAGQGFASNISVLDYSGQPMAKTPVTVTLCRRIWNRKESQFKGVRSYEQVRVVTDDKGSAHVNFNTKSDKDFPTDTYYVVAQADDAGRHQVMSAENVWIASADYPYCQDSQTAEKQSLKVELDKPVYKPGETARIMISGPVTGKEGAQAIVAVEGLKLYSYKLVDLKATATMFELPITKDYAPNAYVAVTYVGPKHQYYHQQQMLRVSPDFNFLKVDIKTDKKKYEPGQTAEYTVEVKDNDGKPAAGVELSMGVVDESIYAIRPEYAADIKHFFYDQRSNYVNTLCTFPEEYSGGPNKIEPRVRKDFKDTAAWFPNLVTDKNGIARAKFKLPDNLTTWRATVRGINMQTSVGWALSKVVSTQELIVRLALPRFFSQGDEGEISAIVHNYSDTAQNIKLTLSATGQFAIKKALADSVKVEPDKAARVTWPVKVERAGTATIGIKAVGQTKGDAMEVKLPIRGLGVPIFVSRSGFCIADGKDIEIPVSYPADAADGSVKTTLSVSSSALGPVLGNFGSLIDYPYGCTEQTMSRLMPAVVAMKINKTLGVPLPASDIKRFKKVYEMGIAKLYEHNHSDGGWGWWTSDESNMGMTSLVLEGFKLLKETGYDVEQDRINRGLDWLEKTAEKAHAQLTDPKTVKTYWQESELVADITKAMYIDTLYGRKIPDKIKAWVTTPGFREKLTPESLAYLSMALKLSGAEADAQETYNRLIYLANVIEESQETVLLNWERTPALLKKLTPKKDEEHYYYSYRYTGVETTAIALRAALVMEPSNIARLESIKQWILTQRGKDGWGNTKATSAVFRAFTEDEKSHKDSLVPSFAVSFLTTGNTTPLLPSMNFDGKSIYAPERASELDLKPGSGSIVLKKTGPGKLYWTVTQTYNKTLKPGDTQAIASTPEKLSIAREFFRLVATPPDSNGNVHFKQTPLTGNVKAGETILMRVSFDSPLSVPYTLVEAALPSGGEVVSNDPKENLSETYNESSEIENDYGWDWWWTHQDVLDDHLAYFITDLPAGKHEVHTMVRMELPGKFQMNPVTLEGMYTDKIHGYSTAGQINVVE